LQDPHNIEKRSIESFKHVQDGETLSDDEEEEKSACARPRGQ
jgi:hypothetical protein